AFSTGSPPGGAGLVAEAAHAHWGVGRWRAEVRHRAHRRVPRRTRSGGAALPRTAHRPGPGPPPRAEPARRAPRRFASPLAVALGGLLEERRERLGARAGLRAGRALRDRAHR